MNAGCEGHESPDDHIMGQSAARIHLHPIPKSHVRRRSGQGTDVAALSELDLPSDGRSSGAQGSADWHPSSRERSLKALPDLPIAYCHRDACLNLPKHFNRPQPSDAERSQPIRVGFVVGHNAEQVPASRVSRFGLADEAHRLSTMTSSPDHDEGLG